MVRAYGDRQVNESTGTVECLRRAWEAHEAELLGFLEHRLGARDAAEDVLQDVFLKSLMQGSRFCTVETPRAWLFSVARRTLIDHLRSRKPHTPLSEDLSAPEDEGRSPVDELAACLRHNLALMPAEDREVIERCDLEGATVRGYAEEAGLSLPAAKSRLLRARQRLRVALVRNCQVRFDENGRVCCHVDRASC
jgi:RNA polymerase sigma-70 factor (ECF subfamily)